MHRPRTTALLAALGALATATALAAGPAAASERPTVATAVTGTVDASLGLNLHSASPTGAVIGAMPYGTRAHITCWTPGPQVTGPYGATTVWDAVDEYTTPSGETYVFTPGPRVYASDAWIDTGGDTSRMVPRC